MVVVWPMGTKLIHKGGLKSSLTHDEKSAKGE